MSRVTVVPRVLMAGLAVVVAVLVAVLIWSEMTGDPHSEVVGDAPSRPGWKTVEFESVRIDVPSRWERVDMSDCEFQFEGWAPPESDPCGFEAGAAFYRSATFDPAFGPGVRRTTGNGTGRWGGYAYAGDFAVYASDHARTVVREVLDSVREVRR